MSFSQDDFRDLAKNLGRSDEFIEVTTEYAARLQSRGLPVIFSTHHFCLLTGLDDRLVTKILEDREGSYRYYQIRKRGGGHRQIMSPYNNLKQIQGLILHLILNQVRPHRAAYGFIRRKSITDNAKVHLQAKYVLNVDLFKFFDTISEKRVFGLFKSMGYASNLSVDLAKLCTAPLPTEYLQGLDDDDLALYRELVTDGTAVLPQGAPTSPAISNLISRKLDTRLSKLAEKLGSRYSRYADDVTFSGEYESLPYLKTLEQIVREEGLQINRKKIRLYRKGRRQSVTGLTLDDKVYVNRKFKQEVKKHVYGCKNFGPEEHMRHIGVTREGYKEWLLGKIMFINSVEPELAATLLRDFNDSDWPY